MQVVEAAAAVPQHPGAAAGGPSPLRTGLLSGGPQQPTAADAGGAVSAVEGGAVAWAWVLPWGLLQQSKA